MTTGSREYLGLGIIYAGTVTAFTVAARLDPKNDIFWFSLITVLMLSVTVSFEARFLQPWKEFAREQSLLLEQASQRLEELQAAERSHPSAEGQNPANGETPDERMQELAAKIARLNERLAQMEAARFPESLSQPGTAPLPQEPRSGGAEAWVAYYHAMKAAGLKITFRILAEKSGYDEGTLRNQHAGCEDPACARRKNDKK